MKHTRNKNSIYHKIIFIISLLILFLIGVLTVKHINNISKSTKLLMHSYEVNLELEHLFSYIKGSENNMRGYLITKDTLYLNLYRNDFKNVNDSFSTLQELITENPKQVQNLEILYGIIKKRYEYMDNYSNEKKEIPTKDFNFRKIFRENNTLLTDIVIKLNEMVQIEKNYLRQRNSLYNNQIYLTPIITLGILFITLLLLIFTYYKTTNDISRLQEANVELSKSHFLSYQAEILSDFGTWEWQFSKNKITYSDNLFRLLGCHPQSFEAGQENFIKFVHPEDIETVENIFLKIVQDEDLQHSYFRIIRADNNQTRILRSVGKLFVDSVGNKTVLGVTGDVTDEHNKNELLKSNYEDLIKVNNKLKMFDESSKQAEILGKYGSWILNYDNLQFTYSDNQFRLLGFEPQSFEPNIDNLLDYVHPEDTKIIEKAYKKALSTMEMPTTNYRIITQSGKTRQFRTLAKSFTDLRGAKSMIGTTQDVTEEYKKSLQLKQRNLDLEKHVKELNDFNQVASHDLQEPLRKIQTFISRINDRDKANMSETGKEYITRIEMASDRMRVLINDLLQYSKANRTQKNLIPTDLNDTIKESLIELSQNIEDKKAIVNYTELPIINGISFQMQQLFTNLLSNSLKYSKSDISPIISIDCTEISAKNEVELNDKSSKKYYKIIFSDNGIGFEQEHSKKIFSLFKRLHGKTEYQGTGVGLAICKKIIENHKGFVFAYGIPNEGSTFTIYFPVPA